MSGVVLTPADQAEIDRRMNLMEAKDIARTANQVVEMCFQHCVNDFHSKEMGKKEKECIRYCSGKYTESINRIYQRYQEIRTTPESMPEQ